MPFTRLWRMRSLLLVGPALVADALAREVDDRVDAFERGRVDQPRLGIPPDVVTGGDAAALQPQHTMAGPPELAAERGPDEPTRPADDDVHAGTVASTAARTGAGRAAVYTGPLTRP